MREADRLRSRTRAAPASDGSAFDMTSPDDNANVFDDTQDAIEKGQVFVVPIPGESSEGIASPQENVPTDRANHASLA